MKRYTSFRITPRPNGIYRALCNAHLSVVFALADYRLPLSQSNYLEMIHNLLTFFSQPFLFIFPYINIKDYEEDGGFQCWLPLLLYSQNLKSIYGTAGWAQPIYALETPLR